MSRWGNAEIVPGQFLVLRRWEQGRELFMLNNVWHHPGTLASQKLEACSASAGILLLLKLEPLEGKKDAVSLKILAGEQILSKVFPCHEVAQAWLKTNFSPYEFPT